MLAVDAGPPDEAGARLLTRQARIRRHRVAVDGRAAVGTRISM
jgi:hypothetical protein